MGFNECSRAHHTRTISERLTWAEICQRYPDEWVCLVEVEFDPPNGVEIRTGRVIGHGKTRGAPFDQAMQWRADYEIIDHVFTGRIEQRIFVQQIAS